MTADGFRLDQVFARRVFLQPLLDLLEPVSVVVCNVDDDSSPPVSPLAVASPMTSCLVADLEDALDEAQPDLIWIRGRPTWHSLRTLAPAVVAHANRRANDAPVVLVEGGFEDSTQPDRAERAKEGIRLGLADLGAHLDARGHVEWWAPGPGVGAFVPSTRLATLASALDERRPLLDAVNALHARNVELDARSLTLFELLDQSQHNAAELVKSLRFRLGTRAVRLGRRIMKKERLFRAPVEIVARDAQVAQWRARFAAERTHPRDTVAPGALRVTYIVPELRLSGGVLVVLQLVTELRHAGIDARIVARKDRRREVFSWWLATRPKLYSTDDELAKRLAPTDIVVATHWRTVSAARGAVASGRARHAAYFLQDYEPWFVPEADGRERERVRATFGAIPNRIVTSDWLRTRLEHDGFDADKVALGIDLGFFYPRPVPEPNAPVVFAMARPRTPRRGFDTLVAALTRVHNALPDTEIVLFGEDLRGLNLPFPYRAEGMISDRERLAEQYSAARVYADLSDFQAFGLPTLEAMACGTTAVVTDVGGVHEYAVHEQNCLTVPARDADAAALAIIRLLTDDTLHDRIRAGALTTTAGMSMREVAQRTRELFEKINTSTSSS